MISEINGLTSTPIKGQDASRAIEHANDKVKPVQASAGIASDNNVALTSTAALLREVENAISELPEVNTERVEAIRKAIAEGSYQIDPSRIADKLMQLENALGKA